jgi:phytoene dehydrogenase-like protein
MWAGQATMPGGLLRGAAGYQATVQVRLLHADAIQRTQTWVGTFG